MVDFSKQYAVNYSGTGAGDWLPIDPTRDVTVGVSAGASDVYSIEVQITDSGNAFVAESSVSNNLLKTLDGPVLNVRINIATNSSGDIDFEVAQAARRG